MDKHKIQDMTTRVHIVLERTNAHDYNNLSLDARGEMCMSIARIIIITQEEMEDGS